MACGERYSVVIQPKVWGFVCATAHPLGCELNVRDQIAATRALGLSTRGPRRVLIIGSSAGYGLAARIAAAFGFSAATLGVSLEKPAREIRPASAGWYNTAAFHKFAAAAGLPALSVNADAFADSTRRAVIDLIRREWGGGVDLVIYSLAAPLRRMPDGSLRHTSLKPIGFAFAGTTIDTTSGRLVEARVAPASEQEIADTVAVMGGENWALWIEALHRAGVLVERARTLAFSYLGPELTWPIYWHGTIGRAKRHLENTAAELRARFASRHLEARVAVMKSIVTQASAAIPVMPLYVAVVFKVMKNLGLHEAAIQQQNRLFRDYLYREDGVPPVLDAHGRLRLDDRELRSDVQQACKQLWARVTSENLMTLTDYSGYQSEFLRQFGFGRDDVDYSAEVSPQMACDCVTL